MKETSSARIHLITGCKSLVSISVNSYLLKTYDLIFDILLSQHKLNFNNNVFGMNT
jgi:hypothetical protein